MSPPDAIMYPTPKVTRNEEGVADVVFKPRKVGRHRRRAAGLIFVVLFVLFNPELGLSIDAFFADPLSAVLIIVALLGQMAGIAGLHTLQRGLYGRLGAAGSLVAFVGFALQLVIGIALSLIGDTSPASTVVLALLFLLGVLASFVGLALLGVATLRAQVLPSWFWVLLIVGLLLVIVLV